MQKRFIGDTEVSLLGFGCMRLPKTGDKIDYELGCKMVDYAYQNGVNYFDTAYMYHGGESEVFIGKALKKYPRESYYLADKFPIMTFQKAEDMEGVFNEQLKRCDVDYFDFYLVHSLDAATFEAAKRIKLYEFLTKKKEEGFIRRLGFSIHDTPDVLKNIIDEFKWDFAQIQYNYVDYSYLNAELAYKYLCDANIPIVVMEPVRGGFLNEPTPEGLELISKLEPTVKPAELALRWVAGHENVKVILSGMSDMQQTMENVQTLSTATPLTDSEHEAVEKIVEIIHTKKTIPCTACRYCMECPFGVDIPAIFSMYNYYKILNKAYRTRIEYFEAFDPNKRAEHCTSCGACVKKCPQHIDIPKELRDVETLFKTF